MLPQTFQMKLAALDKRVTVVMSIDFFFFIFKTVTVSP